MDGIEITKWFFIVCGGVFVIALSIMGIVFIISSVMPNKESETKKHQYNEYSKKGRILRICYGFCVVADLFLTILEVGATAIGAYIVLIADTPSYWTAFLLIITLAATNFRNALNLKNARTAYARAFRILEFAVDDFWVSNGDEDAIQKLHEANEQAQKIIEELFE